MKASLILGENVEQTYGRIISLTSILFEKNIIPIIIGGSQDLLYANYRAYDSFKNTVNLVNIDSNFDLGDSSKPINNLSYLGKIILEEPHNLFNYSNLVGSGGIRWPRGAGRVLSFFSLIPHDHDYPRHQDAHHVARHPED